MMFIQPDDLLRVSQIEHQGVGLPGPHTFNIPLITVSIRFTRGERGDDKHTHRNTETRDDTYVMHTSRTVGIVLQSLRVQESIDIGQKPSIDTQSSTQPHT